MCDFGGGALPNIRLINPSPGCFAATLSRRERARAAALPPSYSGAPLTSTSPLRGGRKPVSEANNGFREGVRAVPDMLALDFAAMLTTPSRTAGAVRPPHKGEVGRIGAISF